MTTMAWALGNTASEEAILEVFDTDSFDRRPQDLSNQLTTLKSRRLLVTINSAAGDDVDGLEIFAALRRWRGEVRTFTRFAGAGAFVIALAAPRDKRLVSPDGVFLLQQPHVGSISDVTSMAARLRSTTATLTGILADEVGWDAPTWDVTMAQQMWWSGQAAVDEGLAAEVVTEAEARRPQRPAKAAQPSQRGLPQRRIQANAAELPDLAGLGQAIAGALPEST